MIRNLSRTAGGILLALLVVAIPVLGGCGDKAVDKNVVTVGYLGDFTGAASLPCQDLYKGITDYFTIIEEEDPVPGLHIKMITYDTKMDYSRAPVAFQWLKGQGSDIVFDFSPIFTAILKDKHEQEKIPCFTLTSAPDLIGAAWISTISVDYPIEAELAIKWITEEWWDYDQMNRSPIVGHMGCSGYESSAQVRDTLDRLHNSAPDSFDLKQQFAPVGTTAWASEIGRLIDCDVIIVNLLGPQPASFLREATNRGYQGKYLGTSLCFGGSWELIKSAAAKLSDLDGALLMHAHPTLKDNVPFVAQVEASLQRFRSSEDIDRLRWTYFNGQEVALILVDIIRRAAAEVGPENVDPIALNNSMENINLTLEGWGEPLKYHDGLNILHRPLRVIEFRVTGDSGDWYANSPWMWPTIQQ